MKTEGHPKYYTDCKVTCVCGNTFLTGSTLKEINVEICSACHPFYTGKQKLIDVEGRVERFQKRYAKFESQKTAAQNPKQTTEKP